MKGLLIRVKLVITQFVDSRTFLAVLLPCVALTGCNRLPGTLGEMEEGRPYGYTPLDPLPVILTNAIMTDITNAQVTLAALPDETMRLAVGQISGSGNISYGSASIGYAGSNYVVVLDYMKYVTLPLPLFSMNTGPQSNIWIYTTEPHTNRGKVIPDHVLPVYVGVGLRITASVKVNSGSINLGNLVAVGAAADGKMVSGTLVIQTMGISGQAVSSTIPIPTDINGSTIANALMALGQIKSKFYDNSGSVTIKPQVLAVYNNLGTNMIGTTEMSIGTTEMSKRDFIAPVLLQPPILNTTVGYAQVYSQPLRTTK